MIDSPDKQSLRRHFRRLRRQSIAAVAPALRAVALRQLPALLAPGLRLGLYWPLGSEPDLQPLARAGLAERLGVGVGLDSDPNRLALPAVLPAAPGAVHGRLVYLPWQPDAPLRPDACGIPAPLPADGLMGPDRGPAERHATTAQAGSEAATGAAVALPAAPGPVPADLPMPVPGAAALAPGQLGLLLVPALALDRHGIRLGSGGGWYDRLRADPAWRAVPALAVLPAACRCELLPADPWDVPFDGWLDERGIGWLAPGRKRGP